MIQKTRVFFLNRLTERIQELSEGVQAQTIMPLLLQALGAVAAVVETRMEVQLMTAQAAVPVEVTQVEEVVVGAVRMTTWAAEPAGPAVRLTFLEVVAVRVRTVVQAQSVVMQVVREVVLLTAASLGRGQRVEEEVGLRVLAAVGLVQVAVAAVGFTAPRLWERFFSDPVVEAEAAMTAPPGLAPGLTAAAVVVSS